MSDELPTRRRGKIAQCPRKVREQICRMLDDGKQASEILAWANGQTEVVAMLAEKFDAEPISDNNLSQWFKGGFLEWLRDQEKIEETEAKMELSLKMARAAGTTMSEGVLAIAAGRIMTALESAEGDELVKLASGAAVLRGKEIDKEKLALAGRRADQRDTVIALEQQKFQRLAVGNFIDWAENQQAIEIATGEGSREVKMDQLIQLMFGDRPTPPPDA